VADFVRRGGSPRNRSAIAYFGFNEKCKKNTPNGVFYDVASTPLFAVGD
jgi:hypothetical protein